MKATVFRFVTPYSFVDIYIYIDTSEESIYQNTQRSISEARSPNILLWNPKLLKSEVFFKSQFLFSIFYHWFSRQEDQQIIFS